MAIGSLVPEGGAWRRRRVAFAPGREILESRCAAAAIPPTALDQLFLERLNDARAELGASHPGDPAFQPLVLSTQAKSVAVGYRDSWSVNRIKAELRRSVRLDEKLSIVSRPTIVRIDSSPVDGSLNVIDPNGHSRAVGRIDDEARITAEGLAYAARRNRAYGKHGSVSLDLRPSEYEGDAARYALVNLITFQPAGSKPTVTGTVIRDANGNGRYDPGEGLAGVTVSVAGQGSATTFDTGGYNLPLQRGGRVVVTASGGTLASPLQMTADVPRNQNARITFVIT